MATATAIPRKTLERRFDAAIGDPATSPPGQAWKPTEFGESLAWHLISLVCKTAPDGPRGVKAYVACEEDNALDEIMADLRETVVRHVAKAVNA